ncbi:MAG: DsrE family protein [Spirochaetales bacterium]|nr:DsrE family protein [Spirochaetales bacterium]
MDNTLTILWTNADPVTAKLMVFMYSKGALSRSWWKKVRIIIWGATAKLVAENEEIQESLLELKEMGVEVDGCISCANELGVTDKLASLGLSLKKMGEPLTDVIKSGGKLITV